MLVRLTLAAATLALACTSGVHAYGPRGHQMIGAIADSQLSPAAKAAVAQNLGYTLRTAATWADCVRDVQKGSDGKFAYIPDPRYSASCKVFGTKIGKDRMISYARRNWDGCQDRDATKGCHALYHFADVTVFEDHYDRTFTGTSSHDVVSAILAAIAKLKGEAVPAPFDIKDKAEAILMLAHLVGDLHQPLHVGAVYLDAGDHSFDPGCITTPHDKNTETRGGNKLEVGSSNLHSNWDDVLTSWDPTHLSKDTITAAKAVSPSSGASEAWPATWASETIVAAQSAYANLSYTRQGAKKPDDWVTSFPDRAAYLNAKNAVQKDEMIKAGARLAQILNAVLQ